MAIQTFGSPFQPLGSAEWAGAAAAITLSTAPTNVGGFGLALSTVEATLLAAAKPGDPTPKVKSIVFSVEGGTMHVLTDGQTPTATIGIAYAEGVYQWQNDITRIHAAKFFLPAGVTLNVEYGL
jgi:hypothetical protein